MGRQPDKRPVEIRTFPGLQTNVDQRDQEPGGATVQVNATSVKAGELTVRGGCRTVQWSN